MLLNELDIKEVKTEIWRECIFIAYYYHVLVNDPEVGKYIAGEYWAGVVLYIGTLEVIADADGYFADEYADLVEDMKIEADLALTNLAESGKLV